MGRLLLERGLTLAVAESCTGGLLGHTVTSVAGSSGYFLGGVIAYSNRVKTDLLNVDPTTIAQEGAVSEPVAGLMAAGVRTALGADVGLSTTGIAGPAGGTDEKNVGLVFISLATEGDCRTERFEFGGDRAAVKEASCGAAMRMLVEFLAV